MDKCNEEGAQNDYKKSNMGAGGLSSPQESHWCQMCL